VSLPTLDVLVFTMSTPTLLHPPRFALNERHAHFVRLVSPEGAALEVFVLETDVFRVRVLPKGYWQGLPSWSIAPGAEDLAAQGRQRDDLSGFSLPSFSLEQHDERLCIQTAALRLVVELLGGRCTWQLQRNGVWLQILADRPTQACNWGWWDDRAHHYVQSQPGEMLLGLGERAGPLDRSGQRFRMVNIDAMGYSALSSDPLYKHMPFYLSWQPQVGVGCGVFYDTLADCSFDMGRELDNYHGRYRSFVAEEPDLDYYVIAAAQRPTDAVRRFTWMTGMPAWMPRWGLGYSGSTMSYTDAPDAQRRMQEFIDRCREHDVLCDSFHLSSGYTSIGPKRYVFHWNREKFPDPEGFVRNYLAQGIRLCANIKPCLLRDHPDFEDAHRQGLLICMPDGEPAWVQFWDEVGAYLDFTQEATQRWWKAKVKSALLELGMAATWNDNNEFEIWSTQALAAGFGQPFAAHRAKVLQTQLMMRASWQAQREHAPQTRPFLVSRSGGVGMHRYVQTWSGDNHTSWETLRYNLRMGLGLALSGVSNIGHDIGGFAGPAPGPELLVRWVQFGVFMPRFSIHSWNDDQTVNEPWMYPECTAVISQLVKLRYQLVPMLYTLLWQWRSHYQPVMQPTFCEFVNDPQCLAPCDDFLLGDSLLVAPVVEAGQSHRQVYLPRGVHWTCFWSAQTWAGGQQVSLPAPWNQPPMLLREGSAMPLNLATQHFDQRSDERGFVFVPWACDGEVLGQSHEDDGESEAWRQGEMGRWTLQVQCTAQALTLTVRFEGSLCPLPTRVWVRWPASETRPVLIVGAKGQPVQRVGAWQEQLLVLPA
jgi:alpha-glucosidase